MFELLIAGANFEDCFAPFLKRLPELGRMSMGDTLPGRGIMMRSDNCRVFETGVPDLAGLNRHFEADPPVGEHTRRRVALWRDDEVAPKVAVAVTSGESRLVFVPVGGDSAAPHHSAALDLEDVGKVAADGDLKIEPRLLGTVVGDVQVFVDGTFPD